MKLRVSFNVSCQYVSMPVCQYATMPMPRCQYASMPVFHVSCQNQLPVSATGCQFRQYFTRSFFQQKFFAKLLCSYNLGFFFFAKGFGAKAAHKMLVKLTPVAAWFPDMFYNCYLVKNHKTANNSTTTKARENNKHRFGILRILIFLCMFE